MSHSQPQSKLLRPLCYKTLKQIQKRDVFGHFRKLQWVMLATNYLKSTIRQYWIWFVCYFHWKTLFLPYFVVLSKILLYQYGTIICPFSVMLKLKWWCMKGQLSRLNFTEWASLFWFLAQSFIRFKSGFSLHGKRHHLYVLVLGAEKCFH